ncbi:SusC/RagA family TonB-linked outer membrane protein [Mucilaginibacter flavidus]|uniref:SusC/RagA family TonB-linked outer membrane protein n=1 Tax=Mucilaginibacter flavidus TaxID=2949309 RepID=UPI0020935A31|nr:TonB-dependent receptor [Mucilaginibacter flavidus]MCO5950157.1 TonB-dependent receptor [Mucilaginibacter flavidus]
MFKSLLLKGRTLCLLLCCMISSLVVTAQTKHSGKVIGSDDKLPVVGASVRIKGTNTGAVTDVNGEFTLSLAPGNVLVVSYLTYKTKEVTVQGDQYLTISLEPANTTLNEVIVTGYQTQRKKDISGAVASVDVSAAKVIPTTNSTSLLQGQAAGVTVVESGAPGAGANVFVRGISNFGNSSPLYVIDGVQRGGMGDLNPNDIESIAVLKDAGSAAIYGVAGGNGVVVITTKKGKQGKTRFTYDAFYGNQIALGGNPFNVLSADNFEALLRQIQPDNLLIKDNGGHFFDYGYQAGSNVPGSPKGQANAGNPAIDPAKYVLDINNPNNDYLIQKFVKGAGTDWFHALFKNAPQQSHTVSASGANEKNNYYFSLGYLNQQGTLIDTYYKRYQTRINTNFSLSNSIRVGETLSVYYEESPQGGGGIPGGNQSEGNAISFSYRMMPQIPVYDIKGNWGGTYDGLTQLGNAINPVATQAQNGLDLSRGWNIVGSAYGEVDFLKHFNVKTQIGTTIYNYYYNNTNVNPYYGGESHNSPNGYNTGAGYGTQYNWTNTLQYSQVFGKHSVKAFAGFEAKDSFSQGVSASVNNLFSLDPAYVSIGNGDAKTILAGGGPGEEISTLSFFGRLDYIFNDRYILAATIRRDGTSLFFPGKQWGTFPSVSLAWRVSQENFLKGVSWINDLKLRGSYGQLGYVGNIGDGNPYSSFRSSIGAASYAIGGGINSATGGFFASQIGNKKTTWETDVISNVGLDASLFNHLDFTFEWFNKTSKNLLNAVTLPATVGGAAPPTINVGQVSNKGIEISATYHGKLGSAVSFYGGANITTYKSNIDKLSNVAANNYFYSNYQRQDAIVKNQVGHPIGEFYGYQVDGYWNTQAEIDAANANAVAKTGKAGSVFQNGLGTNQGEALGDFRYHDTNGDGVITDADRTFIGNPNPKFTYGVNLGASWKGFDFSTVLFGSYGGKIYNYTKYWTDFGDTFAGNKGNDLLFNSWTPSNPNAATPKAAAIGGFGTSGTINSWYVSGGSFLKMRSATLGYTFNSGKLKALGIDKLHIYAQGVNLFTATKYKGLDPELLTVGNNGLGTDIGAYPNNEKKYIFGVNLSF